MQEPPATPSLHSATPPRFTPSRSPHFSGTDTVTADNCGYGGEQSRPFRSIHQQVGVVGHVVRGVSDSCGSQITPEG